MQNSKIYNKTQDQMVIRNGSSDVIEVIIHD